MSLKRALQNSIAHQQSLEILNQGLSRTIGVQND